MKATSGTTIATTDTNGKYQFRAVDKAGNYSDTLSITLDTVKPVGVLYSGTTAVTSGTKSTASYIKYVASDSLSGINAIYVKKPGATSYVTYTNGEQITENGTYSFYCTDKAGCRSDTLTIYLDNIKPTLSISNGSFGGTLSDSFSVTASDNISGVTLYFKAPNGSNFVKVSGTTMSVSKIMPDGTYIVFMSLHLLDAGSIFTFFRQKISRKIVKKSFIPLKLNTLLLIFSMV